MPSHPQVHNCNFLWLDFEPLPEGLNPWEQNDCTGLDEYLNLNYPIWSTFSSTVRSVLSMDLWNDLPQHLALEILDINLWIQVSSMNREVVMAPSFNTSIAIWQVYDARGCKRLTWAWQSNAKFLWLSQNPIMFQRSTAQKLQSWLYFTKNK